MTSLSPAGGRSPGLDGGRTSAGSLPQCRGPRQLLEPRRRARLRSKRRLRYRSQTHSCSRCGLGLHRHGGIGPPRDLTTSARAAAAAVRSRRDGEAGMRTRVRSELDGCTSRSHLELIAEDLKSVTGKDELNRLASSETHLAVRRVRVERSDLVERYDLSQTLGPASQPHGIAARPQRQLAVLDVNSDALPALRADIPATRCARQRLDRLHASPSSAARSCRAVAAHTLLSEGNLPH